MSWAFMSLPWEQYKPSLRQHQPQMTPFTPSYQKNKQQECLILDLTNLTSQTTIIKSLPNWAPCICTSLRLINRLSVRYEGILDLPNTWVAPARQANPHQIQTLSSTWVVELKCMIMHLTDTFNKLQGIQDIHFISPCITQTFELHKLKIFF